MHCSIALCIALCSVLTYDQAYALLSRMYQYQPAEDGLRQIFLALDQKNRGFIILDDLLAAARDFARQSPSAVYVLAPAEEYGTAYSLTTSAARAVAAHLPLSTVLGVFGEADVDRNRKIGWAEFQRISTHASGNA